MRQRALHIVLALALVLFSWAELAHASDLDAHLDGQSCEVCLFTAHLGHGTSADRIQLPVAEFHDSAPVHVTAAPITRNTYRRGVPRGPPTLS